MSKSKAHLVCHLLLSRRVVLATAIAILGACSSPEVPATRDSGFAVPAAAEVVETHGVAGGSLRYALSGEPATFNLLAANDARSRLIGHLTAATLLEFDQRSQLVRGGLMREYAVSEDRTRVRLALRPGLSFSDGAPLDADDILFTFEKIYEPHSANSVRDALLVDGQPLSVEKLDELTVEVTFPQPSAAAEFLLTTVPILPRHKLENAQGKIEEQWTLDTDPEEMAGLGPFMIARHEPGVKTTLVRNPRYWKVDSQHTRLPYLDEVVIYYVPDRNNQLLRLKAGELDLIDQQLRPEDFALLEGDESVKVEDWGASSNLAFLWFNLGEKSAHPEWFGNRDFRRAICSAISKQAIVQNVFLGRATQATGIIPSSNLRWFADNLPVCRYDPATARSLLVKAGFRWQTGEIGETLLDSHGKEVAFELLTRSDDVLGRIGAIIQSDLKAIGISVSLKQEETRAVISKIMGSRAYESALMNLDFPLEPTDISNVLLSSGPLHMWNPRQAEPALTWEGRIDQLMRLQSTTLDPEERFELFREVQEILAEQVPVIPLVNRNVLVGSNVGLKNLQVAQVFPYAFWNVWELYLENRSELTPK